MESNLGPSAVVTVNGLKLPLPLDMEASFDDIAKLVPSIRNPDTIAWKNRRNGQSGTLTRDQTLRFVDGLVINVANTGAA